MAIKIFIDQGHNPRSPNTGAEGNGLREQDITYAVGQELAALLRSNGNFEVRLSRPTPETQLGSTNAGSLTARAAAANAWGADYFISIHTNAADNPAASGSEQLVFRLSGVAYELARSIAAQLAAVTGLRNRGVIARPGLYVLRRTAMPAVLSEIGFITNPGDAALMASRPDLFALGIYRGILSYLGL
jgi:N-acetylmuramoyl-L-alanine amidase